MKLEDQITYWENTAGAYKSEIERLREERDDARKILEDRCSETWRRGYEIGISVGTGKAKDIAYKASMYDKVKKELELLKLSIPTKETT